MPRTHVLCLGSGCLPVKIQPHQGRRTGTEAIGAAIPDGTQPFVFPSRKNGAFDHCRAPPLLEIQQLLSYAERFLSGGRTSLSSTNELTFSIHKPILSRVAGPHFVWK